MPARAPTAQRLLVAGASGTIGTSVVRRLKQEGHYVRALTRSATKAEPLRLLADDVTVVDVVKSGSAVRYCEGIDAVISCLGASVTPSLAERAGYSAVDYQANRQLLDAARVHRVSRFLYLSAFVAPGYEQTAYVQAHERFVTDLAASGVAYGVVRPTAVFGVLRALLGMTTSRMPLVSDGSAVVNPVHEDDVADACLALLKSGRTELALGGPDVLSRKAIGELAFAATGRPPAWVHLPRGVMVTLARLVHVAHPRMGELLEFGACVATVNCVAPKVGTRRLSDYFAQAVNKSG